MVLPAPPFDDAMVMIDTAVCSLGFPLPRFIGSGVTRKLTEDAIDSTGRAATLQRISQTVRPIAAVKTRLRVFPKRSPAGRDNHGRSADGQEPD